MPFCRGLDASLESDDASGKTTALSFGILQTIDCRKWDCQALVLAPTCELATRIEKSLIALSKHMQASASP